MIDINFDFQKEANYRDSDKYSPTLREYHRLLWSKELPCGDVFSLRPVRDNCLEYITPNGKKWILSSDRAVASYVKPSVMQPLIDEIGRDKVFEFKRLADTIGGIIIWPAKKVDGKITINGHRGFSSRIADRLDLTMECLRRYYNGQPSPLYDTFARYSDYFDLFVDFKGFVDFFLMNDYVSSDYKTCVIAEPNHYNFSKNGRPVNADEYSAYIDKTTELLRLRNLRILNYARQYGL
ncbi:MAG: hypothetical protein Q4C83_01600 [Candidatus Saccharibacteria bacterium]|nr:hypothetical protein [Candidatus Saccharibacteria bacterium]